MRNTKVVLSFVAAMVLIAAKPPAAEGPESQISGSLRTLAGLYGCSYGIGQFAGLKISIGPDGKVSVTQREIYQRRWMNGKITYFSRAGFVVNFQSKKGPIEMKFVFQKGYPKSFFHDDGGGAISVFTRI